MAAVVPGIYAAWLSVLSRADPSGHVHPRHRLCGADRKAGPVVQSIKFELVLNAETARAWRQGAAIALQTAEEAIG
jgi:hypothetical protein